MSEWRPISEAPKDGSYVLLFCPILGPVRGRYQTDQYAKRPRPYWTNDMEFLMGKISTRRDAPTHFMPLPPPPETGR